MGCFLHYIAHASGNNIINSCKINKIFTNLACVLIFRCFLSKMEVAAPVFSLNIEIYVVFDGDTYHT